MRFFCKQEELLKALLTAQKAINSQNTLPVLGNVLLKTVDQKLHLSATNLELSIESSIPVDVKMDGAITVPVKILTSWVSFLKQGEIEVRTKEDDTVYFKTPEAKTTIKGISAEEFPVLPKVEEEVSLKLPAQELKETINEVIFSCAHSTVRPVLSGVLVRGDEDRLRFATTDSYRLSEKSLKLEGAKIDEVYSIIPARTMIELERILSKAKADEEVRIAISQNQILFEYDTIRLTSRLIDGKFPEYEKIIPDEIKTNIAISKEDFVLAIKRVGIFAKENSNNMRFNFDKDQAIITTNQTEIGTEEASIAIKLEGDSTQTSLNGQFLLDILSVINEDEVLISVAEKLSPVVIRGKSQTDYVHVIMPLKL
jgi:DNA polymerase-3 subunit beta